MKHSTEIAEELGHVKYSNFIRDYYRLLSNCCEENHGEIYQIAGDGVFLTWKTSDCRRKARPIDCFYDFTECLERTAPKFKRRYGIVPSFKAAAHCGKVISTEVGNFGSEMAYHGDVLNTTSRIQTLCSKLGQDFLISEDLFAKLPLPLPHGFLSVKAGFFELRGKKNGILIFSLHLPLT
jgi:adenylate cyclase